MNRDELRNESGFKSGARRYEGSWKLEKRRKTVGIDHDIASSCNWTVFYATLARRSRERELEGTVIETWLKFICDGAKSRQQAGVGVLDLQNAVEYLARKKKCTPLQKSIFHEQIYGPSLSQQS